MFATQAPSASDRACQRIRDALATGELKPGDRIFEVDIARSLGVSRTPVRAALMRLRRDGIVVAHRYHGTFVAPMSAQRFQEVLEYRLALEELAVRSAVNNSLGNRELGRLRDTVAQLWQSAASDDFEAAMRSDLRFHELIVEFARNEPLRQAYTTSLTDFKLCIHATSKHYEAVSDLAREHESFIRALSCGNAEEAIGAMKRHILHGADAAISELL